MLLNTIPVYESEQKDSDSEVGGLDELASILGNAG